MKPVRIQRKRTKGWRLPDNTVCVTRPSKWSNPWRIGMKLVAKRGQEIVIDRDRSVKMFQDMLFAHPKAPAISKLCEEIKCELRGKNLACFCKIGSPCHADWLLKLANEES